jgi:protein-S-isoprenylcysteine O-methyltransferase Ste14
VLVQSGVYAVVRHPIYSGIIIGLVGIALIFGSWAGIACSVIVLLFFDAKSRLEEKWLIEKYPEYPAYRMRVRKLIPFIY